MICCRARSVGGWAFVFFLALMACGSRIRFMLDNEDVSDRPTVKHMTHKWVTSVRIQSSI